MGLLINLALGESVRIGPEITITVIRGHPHLRLNIEAPRELSIDTDRRKPRPVLARPITVSDRPRP